MEYILFIHSNEDKPTNEDQWKAFFDVASQSGMFLGGSEISNGCQFGHKPVTPITNAIGGIMRFETDDVGKIETLLRLHPTIIQGGTVELCEMTKR